MKFHFFSDLVMFARLVNVFRFSRTHSASSSGPTNLDFFCFHAAANSRICVAGVVDVFGETDGRFAGTEEN